MRTLYLLLVLVGGGGLFAQTIPSPKEHFGFPIGEDYQLANFTATAAYFKKVAAASDRVKLVSIGETEEGREQPMLIVTSPENHQKLEHYREISVKMARAEGIGEDEARKLSQEGKAIVWIDGGLHATETVGTHQLIESVWLLASRNDPETRRILEKVIILFTHANPDGQELVSDWFMREKDPKKRSLSYLPRLYQKYAGHDNNRDFYMQNLKESRNIGRQLFVDWIPQIMYNHHQRGPAGSVLAGPPYRDPFNYVFDPMMITGIDAIGAAMYNRLNAEDKIGFTRLGGAVFSTWYNGGLRTTTHFHNMIGILTEIIGGPVPETIPLVPERLIPTNNTPSPAYPQAWHFQQSIDYSVSLNYAVLDYAARNSDHLLYNIYKMGRNSIERGSGDYWTPYPKRIDAIMAAYKAEQTPVGNSAQGASIPVRYYDSVLKAPPLRDPRGYVISADQEDFATAVKFINALIRTGIRVEKATAPFTVQQVEYPAGSFVVKTAQAFRPHVLDMFEPQNYPNDFKYPGGPPIAPYDAAGWTLAFQMGIQFDRFLDDFTGPFEQLPYGELQTAPGKLGAGTGGYLLKAAVNDSYLLANRLLKSGQKVYRITGPKRAGNSLTGSFYVPYTKETRKMLEQLSAEQGLAVTAFSKKPDMELQLLTGLLRVGLWDTYGGSMPSGWMRWLLEQYGFDFKVVYPKEIDAGNLRAHYDVLVFPTRAIPAVTARSATGVRDEQVPEEFRDRTGTVTAETSVPQLKEFLNAGGKIVAIGTSTNLAYHLDLPVRNALTQIETDGKAGALPSEKYYIPGSILQVRVDTTIAANSGLAPQMDVYFDRSPVFHLSPAAIASGKVRPLAWFGEKPLRSGWAWGEAYLKDGVAAFEASVGEGTLYAFGPEITFRAQSHGTFKWLFGRLY